MRNLRQLLITALLATPLWGLAGATSTSSTIEVSVQGLNCALCGDAMKASLKKVTGAKDLEPRLECGVIYLEMPPEKASSLNEAGLSFTLMANGFNFKGARPVPESLSQLRAMKEAC